MFAEYAVLYARMEGQSWGSVPPRKTMAEGTSIADQAALFVTQYMTPIVKVHKLLSHVLVEIRMHGNLKNGNTADTEAQHNNDKTSYTRTNKDPRDFTRQLVVRSQGSREVLEKLTRADQTQRRPQAGPPSSIGGAPEGAEEASLQGRESAAVSEDAAPSRGASVVGSARNRNRDRMTVAALAERPGLTNVSAVLGADEDEQFPVLSLIYFTATLDCGSQVKQLQRAAPIFLRQP